MSFLFFFFQKSAIIVSLYRKLLGGTFFENQNQYIYNRTTDFHFAINNN